MDRSTPYGADLRSGTLVAGRYEVVRRVGAGGMGVVYEARDRRLENVRVALKCISPYAHQDPASVERFRREVALAQRVSHPNVCRVHDLIEARGRSFLSMEFIEGHTLAEYLAAQAGRRIAPQDALPVLLQALDGVAAIHAAGIVHRDLKPANVMIADDGRVRVMDFGVALAPDLSQISAPGALLGTLAYMAPEQWRGEPLDARADIYALGVILYETFTGRRPFEGDLQTLMHQHLSVAPLSPRNLAPDVSENVATVILYCLNKRPDERFENALALRQSLEDAVTDEQTFLAPPPGDGPTAAAHEPASAPLSNWNVGGDFGRVGNVGGNVSHVGRQADRSVHNAGNGAAGAGNRVNNAGGGIQTIGEVQAGGPVNFGNGVIHAGGNTHAGSIVTTNIQGGGAGGLGVVAGGALALVAVMVVSLLVGLGYLLWQRLNPADATQSVAVSKPSPSPSSRAKPRPALTPDRSVHVTCAGEHDVCATLEESLIEDLSHKGIRAIPSRDSAHARVTLRATLTDTREEEIHGASFKIRQYALRAEAVVARSGTRVALPSGSLQADTLVGREALDDSIRTHAMRVSDAVAAAIGR